MPSVSSISSGGGGATLSFPYDFDTGTSAADPGAGKVRVNNATLASATAIYIDQVTSQGANISSQLNNWVVGTVTLYDADDASKYAVYALTSVVSHAPYYTLTVTYDHGNGALVGAVVVAFSPGVHPDGYAFITDASGSSPTNIAYYLRNRTAGGIGSAVATLYPAVYDAPIALDLMPNGPIDYAQTDGGPAHIDVCAQDSLTSVVALQLARVAILRAADDGANGHVEFCSHDYTNTANPEVWLNPGSAGTVTVPQILLQRATTAAGTVNLGKDGSKVIARITHRVVAVTQSATPSINTDLMDVASITGLAQAVTSMTTNLTGTPLDGDTLTIRLTDNGSNRAIAWGAKFEASTVALPSTTLANAMLVVSFIWNTATSKWRCVLVA